MMKIKKYNIILFLIVCCFIVSAKSAVKNYGICETPDQKLGYCVQYDNCPSISDMVSKMGESILKSNSITICGNVDGKDLVCCADLKNGQNFNIPSRSVNSNVFPSERDCIVKLGDKVVGGTNTTLDEFPWTAVLLYSYKNDNSKANGICGGSLISNLYVVTAAHCAKNEQLTNGNKYLSGVRLGEWNKNEEIDCDSNICADPPQDITIEKIIIHEDYNEAIKAKHNDIALLKLSRTVQFSNFIKPLCLPIAAEVQNRILDNIALDVTGWGRTEQNINSPIKLKASLKTVSLDSCKMIYRLNPPLKETQLCAGGEKDIDSCKGDSGGPLIGTFIPKKGLPYYYLVGIVSVGIDDCGRGGYPGVYTRVASFVPWVLGKVNN